MVQIANFATVWNSKQVCCLDQEFRLSWTETTTLIKELQLKWLNHLQSGEFAFPFRTIMELNMLSNSLKYRVGFCLFFDEGFLWN